jgi:phage regulator Rha-like protein
MDRHEHERIRASGRGNAVLHSINIAQKSKVGMRRDDVLTVIKQHLNDIKA